MSELTGSTPGADTGLIELSADIVAAYVSHNSLSPTDLTRLISEVHGALTALQSTGAPEPVEELKPAVPVRKSVTPDYLVCLEDGKKFK